MTEKFPLRENRSAHSKKKPKRGSQVECWNNLRSKLITPMVENKKRTEKTRIT